MQLSTLAVASSLLILPLVFPGFHDQDPNPKPKPAKAVATGKTAEVGKPAPAFRVNNHRGEAVSVGGKAKTWTVLAFYPKAHTGGCTREVCSLRDAATDFSKLGVTVYGISFDDVATQSSFATKQKLGFDLLSDPDQSVGAKYGATRAGGKPFPKRLTILIDETGTVRHIDGKVSVMSHGADLVALIQRLRDK